MAMEDEDVGSLAGRTNAQTGAGKGGDPGDAGACIDRQPDAVIHPAALKQSAGRGSRSGPGARAAAGIRVLKASHAFPLFKCPGLLCVTECGATIQPRVPCQGISYAAAGQSAPHASCASMINVRVTSIRPGLDQIQLDAIKGPRAHVHAGWRFTEGRVFNGGIYEGMRNVHDVRGRLADAVTS